jgi:hypothetical protein
MLPMDISSGSTLGVASPGLRSAPLHRRRIGWLIVVLLQSACVVKWTPSPKASAATALAIQPGLDAVEVITIEKVDRPFQRIAVVHAPGSLAEQEALATLKQKAQTLHGDALLNFRKRGAASPSAHASTSLPNAPWDAEVIVWTDAETKALSPPPPGAPSHPDRQVRPPPIG